MRKHPNEKINDYLDNDYYIYGMKCSNCGEVIRYVVSKDISYNDFRLAKDNFHTNPEFKQCEYCGLVTRQKLITMTPNKEEIAYYKEIKKEENNEN